jgi:cytidyltransferase-like protein
MKNKKSIAVSGGFDPVHVGHVRMIAHAASIGDVVIVLNSDEWLERKKGYSFMGWDQRAEIMSNIKGVTRVVSCDDSDGTVCDALKFLKSDMNLSAFANGGDRVKTNTPEMDVCKNLNIELIWNCGGEKIESSSVLVDTVRQKNADL